MKSLHFQTTLISLLCVTGCAFLCHPTTRRQQQITCGRSLPRLYDTMEDEHVIAKLHVNNGDFHDHNHESVVCRVVGQSDGCLPPDHLIRTPPQSRWSEMLDKLDVIYHAMTHEETRQLNYMERLEDNPFCSDEEEKLVSTIRASLEDAGFKLLGKRDLDLCEALNAAYLLRLSIVPDLSELDPGIAKEFYPELFSSNTTLRPDVLPFDGRVLIFRRGYSSEVTTGRLLLPKIDYLQANLVQGWASSVVKKLGWTERWILARTKKWRRVARLLIQNWIVEMRDNFPSGAIKDFMKERFKFEKTKIRFDDGPKDRVEPENVFFKLSRYGGSKIRFTSSPDIEDALSPFLICESNEPPELPCPNAHEDYLKSIGIKEEINVDYELYQALNRGLFACEYDSEHNNNLHVTGAHSLPATLLERVSISNIVDYFTSDGRVFFKRLFSKSKVVEPTFAEVFAIWRPKPKELPGTQFVPPKNIYELAEIFDVEELLPKLNRKPDPPPPLEIRAFDEVPMANLLAILPKTRLVFRPADAFKFDLITYSSLLLFIGSQGLRIPKLDILAVASACFWLFRTVIRYSNRLARYDLLVKTFLTTKIAHRDSGALKYIATEAGTQRARRAALIHSWLLQRFPSGYPGVQRKQVIKEAFTGVNDLLEIDRFVHIDIDAGLNDLEDLRLIRFSDNGKILERIEAEDSAVETLKSTWMEVFDGKLTLMELIGRRRKEGPNYQYQYQ